MTTKQAMSWEEAVRWLTDQPDNKRLVEACYFDAPLEQAAQRYHASPEWSAVRAMLPVSPTHALDLGAGNGIASYALARDGWVVDAIEPDPSDVVGAGAICRLAAETQLPITVTRVWGETLPFEDARFDLVHARQVLHHAHSLPMLCQELFRVLRPGGTMISTRDHVVTGPAQLPEFYNSHPLHQLYGGEHAYTVPEYSRALQTAGFRITRAFGPFDTPINYAPLDETAIRTELGARVKAIPGAKALVQTLSFPLLCRLLTAIDRRPGRLWSFLCTKP